MKHTTEELLLAAEVRKLAVTLRRSDAAKQLPSLEQKAVTEGLGEAEPAVTDFRARADWDREEEKIKEKVSADWHAQNPLDKYVSDAYWRIKTVADAVALLRGS